MADETVAAKPVKAPAAPPPPAEDIYGLRERFGEAILEMVAPKGDITVAVPRENLLDVCRFLKDVRGFDYAALVTGVDREDRLESVCHLARSGARDVVVVKTTAPYDDPHVPSVTPLWQGANWHEREAYDLLGIVYDGHPDLRRILLPDDWDEHPYPMRKDLKLQPFEGKFLVVE